MSIAVKTHAPKKTVTPPRVYPEWLKARFTDENAPVPEAELEKIRGTISPRMIPFATPVKIFGAEINVPAKHVPPPKNFKQKAPVKVLFKVLSITDKPIFGYSIKANTADLVTNGAGEAEIWLHPGHKLNWSTGRESGWTFPTGSNRRQRMVGMIAMDAIFPVSKPTTVVFIYPESGQYKVNGVTHNQIIKYHSS